MKIFYIVLFVCMFNFCYAQEIKQPIDSTKSIIANEPFRLSNVPSPLYILDNKEIAYDDLNKINVDQIKEINVLKDSAAVAKYGERAKAGVVIIQLADATKPSEHKKRSTNK